MHSKEEVKVKQRCLRKCLFYPNFHFVLSISLYHCFHMGLTGNVDGQSDHHRQEPLKGGGGGGGGARAQACFPTIYWKIALQIELFYSIWVTFCIQKLKNQVLKFLQKMKMPPYPIKLGMPPYEPKRYILNLGSSLMHSSLSLRARANSMSLV